MKKLVTFIIAITLIGSITIPASAADVETVGKPAVVQELKVLKNGYKSLKLNWKAVEGAEKYQVYRSTSGRSGSFVLKRTTTTTSYANTGITCGKTYYYKVRAVNSKGKGSFSSVKSNKVQPATVKITKVRPPRDMDNRVYWNKVSGASGYQVYRSRAGKNSWKLLKTVSSKYTYATDTLSGSDPNYDWEYKVRAYRTVNGKRVYGYFSNPAKWTPDWTIKQIYEEAWKYGEGLKFPEYELSGNEYVPKKDGSMYNLKHVIGHDKITKEYIYTNPLNGKTVFEESAIKRYTEETSNWGPSWPILINPYMTYDSIIKKIKKPLKTELTSIATANPLCWYEGELSGVDTFTIYCKKYGNGYKLWQLW